MSTRHGSDNEPAASFFDRPVIAATRSQGRVAYCLSNTLVRQTVTTSEAKCLAHARRKFIDIERSFPSECGRVLDAIAKVYRVEAETEGMSVQERLEYHQARSGPVMAELREWIEKEFAERRTEPNIGMGRAFRTVLKHWGGLTRFSMAA